LGGPPLRAPETGHEGAELRAPIRPLRILGYLLVLALLSVLRSATSLNYSFWHVDENQIVVRALGFIDGDLNPRWFGYHTLPMYLLSLIYYVEYLVLLGLDVVSTKTEFASLLFSQHGLFFVPARLLFGFAHTLGCAIVALAAMRAWNSRTAAFVVFALAFVHPDAALAASYARVDSFVFLFFSATVYFACYAKQQRRAFLSALVCCAAAFASKIPAIVLYPVMVLKTGYEAWRGLVPRSYVALSLVVPPMLAVIFMPYMLLDYGRYAALLARISLRASGGMRQVGKVHRYEFFERLEGLVDVVASQLGLVTLVLALLFVVWAVVSRDRRTLLCSVFIGAYAMSFSTSTTLDIYWLRPVLPWIGFLAVGMIVTLTRPAALTWIGERLRRPELHDATWLRPLLLIGTAVALIGSHSEGLARLYQSMSWSQPDTRILAAQWLEENLPSGAVVQLEGAFPQYLPPLFSKSSATTLAMTPLNPDMLRNSLLRNAFDEYYTRERTKRRSLDVVLLRHHRYNPKHFFVQQGSYIVTSSHIYDRYFEDYLEKQSPLLTRNARAIYSEIRSQELVKHLEGRGPVIDIYRVHTPISP
jgi:hypothetical protein